MANLIQQLARKTTPPLRILATSLKIPLFSPTRNNPVPILDCSSVKNLKKAKKFEFFYPNSPFGFHLNPVSSSGFDQLKANEGGSDECNSGDERIVWADSVKKKRKRKMNKHKYKKLRKNLRRKAS